MSMRMHMDAADWVFSKYAIANYCFRTLFLFYPGYQRFFSRAAGIFGVGRRPTQRPKMCRPSGHYKDLTETGNRARKVSGTQGISDHFSPPEHYIRDIELIPLQLINSDRDSIRNAREGLLITKGKTLAPYGWAAWVCVNLVQLLQTARKRMKGIKFTRQVGWPWAQFFEGRLSLTSG